MRISFTQHPSSVGESYGEHLVVATGFGARMLAGGLACLVHGLLPFLFTRTGSRIIADLHDRAVVSRARRAPGQDREPHRPAPTA